MCGIIGVVTSGLCVPKILQGLSRLEYRGYDSSGIALVECNTISRYREVGKLEALRGILQNKMLSSGCGIGHTRWATHGKPSRSNAHPHCDMGNNVAVVHNGIIENYKELIDELREKRVILASQTDSEVIPQLLWQELKEDEITKDSVLSALQGVIKKLKGTYAICVVVRGLQCVFATKKCSPLVLGVAENQIYVASDIVALDDSVNSVAYMQDGDICVLDCCGIELYDENLVPKSVDYATYQSFEADIGKCGYNHYMQKEIEECGVSLINTLDNLERDLSGLECIQDWGNIHITACGSALNAGKVLGEVLRLDAGINAVMCCASEYRYSMPNVSGASVGIVISQSGETADTIGAIMEMKAKKMQVIGVTNVETSQIARLVDVNIGTKANKELAVASTKAYVAQLGAMYYLGKVIAEKIGKTSMIDLVRVKEIARGNSKDYYDIWNEILGDIKDESSIYVLGRGMDYVVAEEVALKIKEVSYIHCEALPAGELKHGSLALISIKSKVIVILTQEKLRDKVVNNIREVMARGGQVILVTNQKVDVDVWKLVNIPNVEDIYAPIIAIRPMQQLAYLLAISRGNDPDKPRNLAKSVTVE